MTATLFPVKACNYALRNLMELETLDIRRESESILRTVARLFVQHLNTLSVFVFTILPDRYERI